MSGPFPAAVVFDWDETLAETNALVVPALQSILDRYGLGPWDRIKKEKRDPSKSLKDNFPNFFGAEAAEAYRLYLEAYRKRLASGLRAAPGAVETVEYLARRDVALFIVSNKEKSLLEAEVKILFPASSFKKILGNGDAAHNKPHPAPLWAVCESAGLDPARDEVWMVGDSRQDTDCALAAGCRPILIGKGKFMTEAYWQEKSAVIEKFESLAAFLDRVKSQSDGY